MSFLVGVEALETKFLFCRDFSGRYVVHPIS